MKLIPILCLIIVASSTQAQIVFSDDIEWSDGVKQKAMKAVLNPEFIGLYQGKMVTVASSVYGKVYIKEFDSGSLEAGEPEKLNLKYEKNKLHKSDQLIFGDELLIISNYRNKTTKTKHFFIQKYLGGESLSKPKLIASIHWENVPGMLASKKKSGKKYEAYHALKVIVSPDKKRLVVMYPDNVETNEGESAHWNVVAYDQSLNEEWKFDFDMPNANIYLDKVKLTNDGILYCAGVENTVAATYNVAYANVLQGNILGEAFHLVIVDPKKKTTDVIDLNIRDTSIIAYSMDLLDGKPVFYGLTGSGMNRNKADGIFVKSLNKNGEEIFYTVEKFTEELVSYNEDINPKSKKMGRGRKSMKINFVLDDIVITESGDLVFLAEQFNFYTTQQTSAGGVGGAQTQTIPHYVYGDIIAISCTSDGNVKWMNRIVKYQHSTVDAGFYSSYYSMVVGDGIQLLMNDNEFYVNYKELKNADGSVKRKAKKNILLASVIIDANGNIERKIHIEREDKKDYYLSAPKSAILMDDGFLLICGVHVEKKGLVTYDNRQIVGKMPIK